jgi:hypothetical protein
VSVTHPIKTPNQNKKIHKNDPKISQTKTQVPTNPRIGKKRTKLGKKEPKISINRGRKLILTIAN